MTFLGGVILLAAMAYCAYNIYAIIKAICKRKLAKADKLKEVKSDDATDD